MVVAEVIDNPDDISNITLPGVGDHVRGQCLFGSVTPADIAEAIKSAGGPAVDKRRVEVGSPIKTLGAHKISVRLHPEVEAVLDVEVVAA